MKQAPIEALLAAQQFLDDPKNSQSLRLLSYTPGTPIIPVMNDETVREVMTKVKAMKSTITLVCVYYPNRNSEKGKYSRLIPVIIEKYQSLNDDSEFFDSEEAPDHANVIGPDSDDIGLFLSRMVNKANHSAIKTSSLFSAEEGERVMARTPVLV